MRRAVLFVTAAALFAAGLRPAAADTTVSGPITFSTGLAVSGAGAVALSVAPITASLGANVSLSSTGTFYDGPSVAQGASGTWWVCGTVTLIDTGGLAHFNVKLWDGATVLASTRVTGGGASYYVTAALCGGIAAPAGNLRISVQDSTLTTGLIAANGSGGGKDSTITAIRIQ